ncbi:hypothetical protein CCHR01_13701 [Colletotrichum chrysophilum]|uniref:Uncharacterized protein n=1 Tax=Colletotrichum chrysophilum TaxID=1836956 RepID=A0AAD9ABQ0_9PEZI|nr:hypothetical protein CCHR01_13701 [Colletotrichum chrysophilum]
MENTARSAGNSSAASMPVQPSLDGIASLAQPGTTPHSLGRSPNRRAAADRPRGVTAMLVFFVNASAPSLSLFLNMGQVQERPNSYSTLTTLRRSTEAHSLDLRRTGRNPTLKPHVPHDICRNRSRKLERPCGSGVSILSLSAYRCSHQFTASTSATSGVNGIMKDLKDST